MSVSDVNWILSSAVQSGAALVAIVGGLLGSRYVSLHAEQQAARRRLIDAERRAVGTRERADNAERDLVDFWVADLLDTSTCYELISESVEPVPLDAVLDAIGGDEQGVPREALEIHLQLLIAEYSRASELLKELVPETESQSPWDSFRRAERLRPGHEGIWEWTYERVSTQRRVEARERRLQQPKVRGPFGMPNLESLAYDLPTFVSVPGSIGNQGWRTAKINRLLSARDQARYDAMQLEAEVEAARRHLADTVQPEGFGLALSVLSYIAATSMAVPVVLMVAGPTTLPLWLRSVVAFLFLSGVALLLRFLFVYASYLNRKSSHNTLPRSFIGLLWRRSEPQVMLGEPGEAAD